MPHLYCLHQSLKKYVEKENIGRYEIAIVYAGLGDREQAFSWLEKAFDAHDKGMTFLNIDPCLDPVRSDPRFEALITHRITKIEVPRLTTEKAPLDGVVRDLALKHSAAHRIRQRKVRSAVTRRLSLRLSDFQQDSCIDEWSLFDDGALDAISTLCFGFIESAVGGGDERVLSQ